MNAPHVNKVLQSTSCQHLASVLCWPSSKLLVLQLFAVRFALICFLIPSTKRWSWEYSKQRLGLDRQVLRSAALSLQADDDWLPRLAYENVLWNQRSSVNYSGCVQTLGPPCWSHQLRHLILQTHLLWLAAGSPVSQTMGIAPHASSLFDWSTRSIRKEIFSSHDCSYFSPQFMQY